MQGDRLGRRVQAGRPGSGGPWISLAGGHLQGVSLYHGPQGSSAVVRSQMTVYSTESCLIEAALSLPKGEWTVLACDYLDRGLFGYSFFQPGPERARLVRIDGDDVQMTWPMFDRELRPEVQQVTADELVRILDFKADGTLCRSDCHESFQLGVVSYLRAPEGISSVYRIPVSLARSMPEDTQEFFDTFHSRCQERHEAAAAIQNALSIRA